MRVRCRALVYATLFYLLGAMTLEPTAHGGTTIAGQFSGLFAGNKNGTNYPQGIVGGNVDPLSGNFSYNTGMTPTNVSATVRTYSATGSPNALQFNIVPQDPVTYPIYTDFYKATTSFMITMTDVNGASHPGATMSLTASTVRGGTITLTLTSATYTGLALPSTTTLLSSFVGSANSELNYDPNGFDFDQVGGFVIPEDTLSGISSVPEPSGLVLGLVAAATGGFGFFMSRRRASAV